MEYYINQKRRSESLFWRSLLSIANQQQKHAILDGERITIGGVQYYMIDEDEQLETMRK